MVIFSANAFLDLCFSPQGWLAIPHGSLIKKTLTYSVTLLHITVNSVSMSRDVGSEKYTLDGMNRMRDVGQLVLAKCISR